MAEMAEMALSLTDLQCPLCSSCGDAMMAFCRAADNWDMDVVCTHELCSQVYVGRAATIAEKRFVFHYFSGCGCVPKMVDLYELAQDTPSSRLLM